MSVLVIGGYGGFGTRLCHRLADDGWAVIVAGRNLAKADALADTLPNAQAAQIDRSGDVETVLGLLAPDLVIDAAGPFQGSDYRVPNACITLGVNYLDLADAREFVSGIAELDGPARAANVAVISGASSVPALSGAVLSELSQEFTSVSRVDISISASDKASAGTSVASAILSCVGKPMPIWRAGRWIRSFGWQQVRRAYVEDADGGQIVRLVSKANVPDLDIVPRTMPGHPATFFSAGPEFSFQVGTLWLLSWPVRWGWLGSLDGVRKMLLPLQSLTRPLSDGKSFMTVEICGQTRSGFAKHRWELLATQGRGPEIPTMAAQLLARIAKQGLLKPGAQHAGGLLTMDTFTPLFTDLEITTRISRAPFIPLYQRVMGPDFARLPKPIRVMHQVCGDAGATGTAEVARGKNPLARLVGTIMRFPAEGAHELHVSFREDDGKEVWVRDFSGATFKSELCEKNGTLCERFGPLRFYFDLPVDERGLEMQLRRWSALGVPLPLFLAPRIAAFETCEGEEFIFNVAIALPIIGKVVHYLGRLKPATARP